MEPAMSWHAILERTCRSSWSPRWSSAGPRCKCYSVQGLWISCYFSSIMLYLNSTCIKFPQIEKMEWHYQNIRPPVSSAQATVTRFVITCKYTCSGKLTKKLPSRRDYTPYQTQAIETNNARDLSLPLLFCVTVWNVFLPFLSSPSYWETHKQ